MYVSIDRCVRTHIHEQFMIDKNFAIADQADTDVRSHEARARPQMMMDPDHHQTRLPSMRGSQASAHLQIHTTPFTETKNMHAGCRQADAGPNVCMGMEC